MRYPGFIGPSYALDSYAADVQRSVNLYPEAIESKSGQNVARLVGTPGSAVFGGVAAGCSRGTWCELSTGRLFQVVGQQLYEVFADGTSVARGAVAGSDPVTWASNRIQLAICGGGEVYMLDLKTNALTNPTSGGQVVYCGTYFLTFDQGTQQFRSRALGETSWNALDFASKEGCPDNIVGIFSDHNELWLMGSETCEPWGPVADPYFGFARLAGTFIEQGLVAPASMAKCDNTVFWLGGSSRGGPIAWRASGYTPQRLSTHAQEIAWGKYDRVDDAIGHSEVWRGHAWWVLTFPSAFPVPGGGYLGATWVYDAATGLWHERAGWDAKYGRYIMHPGAFHAMAFGKHLVCGPGGGNLYELSDEYFDDAGAPIRRERVYPHLSDQGTQLFFSNLEILAEKGTGPTPDLVDGAGNPRGPQMMMRWSNDGGRTWGSERWRSAGKVGEYRTRTRWAGSLGQGRDRVFDWVATDPVYWSLVDCFIDVAKGTS